MTHAMPHHQLRIRLYQKHEPYPHPNKWKRLIDKAIYVAGVFGPLMTAPQLFRIWYHKSAVDVSVLTWSGYLIAAIIWLIYGILHKNKPIIITYALWVLLETLVVIGTLVYG